MNGETNLSRLIATMSPSLVDGVYVFARLQETTPPPDIRARMLFEEVEGSTIICLRADAESHGLVYDYPCRMITLDVHSALESVGFIAAITTEMAKHGMAVNPVSGFYHDHLFVPLGREKEALSVLKALAER